jgi:hypothetical protein
MKPLRLAAIGALLALAAVAIAALYAIRHQTQLVRIVLAQIDQQTGLHIAIAGARLAFRGRVVVVLENPRVAMDGREIARLTDIRATLNYNEIIHHQGLPLHSLVLDRPEVTLAPLGRLAPAESISQLWSNAAAIAGRAHDMLSDISRRIDVNDAEFADESGPLANGVYVSAFQRHPRDHKSPWDIRFNSRLEFAPVREVRLAGDMRLDGAGPGVLSSGRLWFWDVSLDKAGVAGLWLSAQIHGSIDYVLNPGAQLNGIANMQLRDTVAGGQRLTRAVALGAYSFKAKYEATSAHLSINKFAVSSGREDVIEGAAAIAEPFSAARAITFSAGGPSFDLTHIPQWLRTVRGIAPDLIAFTGRLRSGKFTIATVALNTPQPLVMLTPATLRKEVSFEATLAGASYAPMPGSTLPPVDGFGAQIAYSKGIARLTQGAAQLGGSSIADMNIVADLRHAPTRVPYRAAASGQLAVGELYHAAEGDLRRAAPALQRRLVWIHGRAPFTANASGLLSDMIIAPPPDYRIAANLGDIQLEINNAPSAIALTGGGVVARPGSFSLDHAEAVMIDQKTGSVVLNGAIIPGRGAPVLRNFTVELHQIETSRWLPMFVKPSQLAVKGLLGGRLVVSSNPAGGSLPLMTGRLTLGSGSVQPSFLRSPMMIKQAATLKLDGGGAAFDIPEGTLEGSPLSFRAAIADFDRPALRIDARAERLNFEVMRFIRLPWVPKTPSTPLPLPVSGHIDAGEGNLAQLVMTDISTDFSHTPKAWRVYNFHAKAFNGDANLGISGSGLPHEDWVNIKGRIDSMDAGPLFMLVGRQRKALLSGKLSATADLWADTDSDFFKTLAGNLQIDIVKGHLNRFTLLTRILGFINLKNWLTASFPDPRVAGIPFDTLTGDFKGVRGIFYTDNLRLKGPVMDIIADGNIDLAGAHMDMEIGLVPFNTVSWMMQQIPLIGTNLAGGTEGLIAAYFQVRGPTKDPWILPKPITSVAQFLIKTLGLPINIIRPNTVK